MSDSRRSSIRNLSWLGIGAMAGAGAMYLSYALPSPIRESSAATQVAAPPVAAPIEIAPPVDDAKVSALEAKLATAASEIYGMRAQRTQEWEQTASLIEAILELERLDEDNESTPMQMTIEKMRRRMAANDGELSQISDFFFFSILTAISGPTAIQDIVNTIEDPSVDLGLRKRLLDFMFLMPTEASLKVTLYPPDDLADDASSDPGMLALIADALPRDQVVPYVTPLYDVAMADLARSPGNESAWSLIGVLALNHGYAPAKAVLDDPDNFRNFGAAILDTAWWIGSDESRAYIERIAHMHPDPNMRASAREILLNW